MTGGSIAFPEFDFNAPPELDGSEDNLDGSEDNADISGRMRNEIHDLKRKAT